MDHRHNTPQFVKLKDAVSITGLSMFYLRRGCRDGSIPSVRSGQTYYVNVPALIQKLDDESREGKSIC